MCGPDVVKMAKVLLQRPQPLLQRLDLAVVKQVLQELDRVAQFLQRDPELVALFLRQLAELPAALARSAPPALDEARSDLTDGREEQGGLLRCRLIAPPTSLEPSGKAQHSRRIALGLDPFLSELIGLLAPPPSDFCEPL